MTIYEPTENYQNSPSSMNQHGVLPGYGKVLITAMLVSFILFGVFYAGQVSIGYGVVNWLESWRHTPFAIPVIVAGFVVLSFVAVPQFVLISMCVVAFGPLAGLGAAWSATMISAWLSFMAGPLFNRAVLHRVSNAILARMMGFVALNSFWSALFVRFVPSGPFVLVNLTLGAARGRLVSFLWGTAIGILPKAILIAMTGAGLSQAANGRYQMLMAILTIMALIWLVLAIFGKRMALRLIKQSQIAPTSLEIKRAASQKG